jgi:hypothetical protein
VDDRDARAADRAALQASSGLWAFWAFWLVPPQLFGGVTWGDAIFLACCALGVAMLTLVLWLLIRKGPRAATGPLAGLGPADIEEVTGPVRKGRAVSNPTLAPAAAEHARQKLRLQSIGRYVLPVIIVVRVASMVADPPASATTTVAYGAVVVAPVLALWALVLVGYGRSNSSETANWRLIEGGGAR